MTKFKTLILGALFAAVSSPALAQDASTRAADREDKRENGASDWHLYLSSGLSFSQRDEEGEPRTNYFRIPVGVRLSNGGFRLSASIPYVIVNGPGSVVSDDDGADGGEPPLVTDRGTRRGFGDLRITARYRIPDEALGGFELDLMGRVKLPTASRRERLGTGETDYAVGAELSRDIGKLKPFVSGQYRINGDPADRDYRNTVAASVGTGFDLGRRSRASLAWDYAQSRTRGRKGSHMLDAGLSTRLARRLTLSGDAAVGLSENAPDFRVGASLTARVF